MSNSIQTQLKISDRVVLEGAMGIVVGIGDVGTTVHVVWDDNTVTEEAISVLEVIVTPEDQVLHNAMILLARAQQAEADAKREIDTEIAALRAKLDKQYVQMEQSKQTVKGLTEAVRALAVSINAATGTTKPHPSIYFRNVETVIIVDETAAKQWLLDHHRFDALDVKKAKLNILIKADLLPEQIAMTRRVATPSIESDLSALLAHDLVEIPTLSAPESDALTTETEAQ